MKSTIKQKTGVCPECLKESQEGTGAEPLEVILFAGLCLYHKRKERAGVYASRQAKKLEVKSPKKEQSIPELLELATIVFNKWIRNRDSKNGLFVCISCGEKKPVSEMDAGHFIPSTYSATRFNEYNVNGECQTCNRFDPDHLIGYRTNLEAKISAPMVRVLERISKIPKKWDRSELLDLIKEYKEKLKAS